MQVELAEQVAGQGATSRRRYVAVMLCGMMLAAAGATCQAAPPGIVPGSGTPTTGTASAATLPDSGPSPTRDDTVGASSARAQVPTIAPHNITSWSNLSPSTSGHPLYKCTDGKGTSFQDTPCGKSASDQNHEKNSYAKPVY